MNTSSLQTPQGTYRQITVNTVVVGSGAAGFNAVDRLWMLGQHDVAIVTEHVKAGTSRNTGSDKQTYYKLTLSGGDPDSVREMAETLFSGECVDGDIALCEAALSAQGFLRLAELGVPFPKNRYGEYVGYKTDHDPRRRATSVGPYTSKRMTEALEKSVNEKQIPIFDRMQVIRILSDRSRVYGLLCLDTSAPEDADSRFVVFRCKNVIYATGGPAGIYADSVYPFGHFGATGIAFEAGVRGKNLTEWQYGLASTRPRWNVSGTYMQVMPRFLSTNPDGSDEREFLFDFFTDTGDMLTKVFLKGYQWPFDVRKVKNGSSIIDILVYLESCKGRKVFLDFRSNPGGGELDFSALGAEARDYMEKAGACFGTPYERLLHMNTPAVEFYRGRGVDLAKEPLEIALCAQHNNGGLAINAWWHTNLEGFFAAGEVSASHGVYRPGGSALNAGQVGSFRAAEYIAARRTGEPEEEQAFLACALEAAGQMNALADEAVHNTAGTPVQQLWDTAAVRMSRFGAAIRSGEGIDAALEETRRELSEFSDLVSVASPAELSKLFRLRDVLICQQVYLSAMRDYLERGGKSRGSALYTDPDGEKPYAVLPDTFTFRLDNGAGGGVIQEAVYQNGACKISWRPVRPIPEDDDFFENVWRSYRENGNIDE
ncbi:FAD-binding protein [Faecalispora jeddahensis]|uniref:FAD-binding protein n=1 Tax=Faecalispora jeddahensis TaxID=1414721 RepID=UPI001898D33E|nr:FAD-binding protein [Faecalispora jeddahensis]